MPEQDVDVICIIHCRALSRESSSIRTPKYSRYQADHGSFHHGLLQIPKVERKETFFTVAVADWNAQSDSEDFSQTRILCLFWEAIYTIWLQAIWYKGLKENECFIRLCPWDSTTLPYRGACRESPLRQIFSLVLKRRSREEKRREDRERQRLYREKLKMKNKPIPRPLLEAHNEARRESRKRDTPELRLKRLARRSEPGGPGHRRCMNCGEEGHYIRTCPHGARPTINKCSICRQPGHTAKKCEKIQVEEEA